MDDAGRANFVHAGSPLLRRRITACHLTSAENTQVEIKDAIDAVHRAQKTLAVPRVTDCYLGGAAREGASTDRLSITDQCTDGDAAAGELRHNCSCKRARCSDHEDFHDSLLHQL